MNKYNQLKFANISSTNDFIKYSDQIVNLTKRTEESLFYLLYKNKQSYAFCILDGENILGFQGFVYKPIKIYNETVPSFRSEFTIAAPQLRGTGIFSKFYKYTMEEIERDHRGAYFWGCTAHKAWADFGFRMIKRYSFYQVFSKGIKTEVEEPQVFNRTPINILCTLFSVLNPCRYFFKKPVNVAPKMSYDGIKSFEINDEMFPVRLFMDEDVFNWRYIENEFQQYLFISHMESLIIIKETDTKAMIVDIYAKNIYQYLVLLTYLMRKYSVVTMYGNVYALYKIPVFWLNLFVGFSTFIGGGSLVENIGNTNKISWRNLPLLGSWDFGV